MSFAVGSCAEGVADVAFGVAAVESAGDERDEPFGLHAESIAATARGRSSFIEPPAGIQQTDGSMNGGPAFVQKSKTGTARSPTFPSFLQSSSLSSFNTDVVHAHDSSQLD